MNLAAASETGGTRVPPPAFYLAGLTAGLMAERVAPLTLPSGAPATAAAAIAIGTGTGFVTSSVLHFKRAGTSVAPNSPTTALVTTGPYRISRNPIYLGFTLVAAGIAMAARSGWTLLLVPMVVGAIDRLVITREQRDLAARYGQEYQRYRARTRRWL
jgi:protein-S-isoprenylcysteine O-methyltransferase Ste14